MDLRMGYPVLSPAVAKALEEAEAQETLDCWKAARELKALQERVLDASLHRPSNRHERRKAAALARRAAR